MGEVTPYTEQQKREAMAAIKLTGIIRRAPELLAEWWDEGQPIPSYASLKDWRASGIEPDQQLVDRVLAERQTRVVGRSFTLHGKIADRMEEELPEMKWRDIKDASIALGIQADKVVPRNAAPVSFSFTDARVILPFGPRELPPPKNVIEGSFVEKTDE